MKFEEYRFNPKIKKALSEMDYKRPTDIQYKSIPNILKGEDLLAVAQTGTGKTAAFAIPLIDMLYEKKINQRRSTDVNCLVLVPTHELALQIHDVFQKIAKYTTLKTMALIGGVDQDPQIMKLYKGVDIIIATPGRVFDLISQEALLTHHIEILVLDEADHMLDLGFIKDIEDLIRKLPKRKQTLFLKWQICWWPRPPVTARRKCMSCYKKPTPCTFLSCPKNQMTQKPLSTGFTNLKS